MGSRALAALLILGGVVTVAFVTAASFVVGSGPALFAGVILGWGYGTVAANIWLDRTER